MRNITKYSFLTFAILLLSMGCKKEFLEPKPLSFFAPENAFIDAAGFDAALVACLRNIRHEFYGDGNPMITENLFSEVAVEGTTDKTGPAMDLRAQILPDANLNSTNTNRIGWYWDEGYRRIRYASVVISRIDNAEYASEEERNHVLGKAYFHRARTYYRLAHQFGDVPLVLGETTAPRLDFYTVTRESILRKCKKDLEFAAMWVKAEWETNVIGDVTKSAVNQVLTKVNLALLEFDDAIASANAIINDGHHALMTERFGVDKDDPAKNVVWDLHQAPNKALAENTERLYVMVAREGFEEDGNSRTSIMRQTVPFWGGTGKIKTPNGNAGMRDVPLGNSGVEIDLVTKYGRGIGRCRQTPYHHTDIWTDPNDLRHAEGNWVDMEDLVYNHPSLKDAGDPYYGQNLQLYDANGGILCTDTIRSWYGWPYYKLYVADPTDLTPDGGRGDWYLYRLAETYLLRAEAYFWKGDLVNAAASLNPVRTRAGAAEIPAGEINMDVILNERARELFYEEPRKTELTRIAFIFAETGTPAYNGKSYSMANFSEDNFWYDRVVEKNIFYRTNVRAPHYNYTVAPWLVLWPVPANAINANVQGHINQNKGYPGEENREEPWVWVDGEGDGEIVPR
ncbi:RagB/SusD family nutrient uptake outer membrane protein [Flavilitoribacter nigricans]|uniref:RagB/SusD family nutrient uptake outer membrane protein n=1 Tax=Flavilitoribacter nigricans (strain ATCC 23147 / DSM 23189 / NBRC 102662 / NCIMB 1420 / SS-2) TaxID=1122177 RepID=A0A2D0N4T0_FLAN2|nr:RagB/SusD family nutrient uptake outer membrane protein [Flavilitoribacter nigricans]PHN03437.1 RagB/SusD family nutrient uptake outer membrane protein [Flavilitoribacter nigricans DSM 23189 = NBRC 102662]